VVDQAAVRQVPAEIDEPDRASGPRVVNENVPRCRYLCWGRFAWMASSRMTAASSLCAARCILAMIVCFRAVPTFLANASLYTQAVSVAELTPSRLLTCTSDMHKTCVPPRKRTGPAHGSHCFRDPRCPSRLDTQASHDLASHLSGSYRDRIGTVSQSYRDLIAVTPIFSQWPREHFPQQPSNHLLTLPVCKRTKLLMETRALAMISFVRLCA
jgi:hypothetical protein